MIRRVYPRIDTPHDMPRGGPVYRAKITAFFDGPYNPIQGKSFHGT
jgi:hypothetical protein